MAGFAISLLMERESLASVVAMIMIVLLLTLVRISLRWYGQNRIRVYPVHVREQLRCAYHAFPNVPS
jgi:hypothetical protein